MGSELVASEFELLVLVASSTVGDVEAVALLSADDDDHPAVEPAAGLSDAGEVGAAETLSF
jgi:hypothetical protein